MRTGVMVVIQSMNKQISIDELTPHDHKAIATQFEWPEEDMEPIVEDLQQVGRKEMLQIVRALMLLCIPPPSAHLRGGCKGVARWRSGFIRMCAMAWVVTPELIEHSNESAFANAMGIPRQVLGYHIAHVRRVLSGEPPCSITVKPCNPQSAEPTAGSRRVGAGPSEVLSPSGSARSRRSVVRVVRSD